MTPKRIAFYTRDTGDPDDTADHQWLKLQAATQDENAQVVRDYVDHQSMSLNRTLGEATQDTPPFDELQMTSTSLLGDTDDETQSRLTKLRDNGVHVRMQTKGQSATTPPIRPEAAAC